MKTLYCFLLLCCPVLAIGTFAQPGFKPFTIHGTVLSADTGEVILEPVSDDWYYPETFMIRIKARIKDGHFRMEGKLPHPTAFLLGQRNENGRWRYLSAPFFIEPGEQKLEVDLRHVRVVPDANNATMEEYTRIYGNYVAGINALIDDLKTTHAQEDSLEGVKAYMLRDYARAHPDSYVALWLLTRLMTKGYAPLYDSIYRQLSPEVKGSWTGLHLARKIGIENMVAPGQRFPTLKLTGMDGKEVLVPGSKQHTNYTLVDFWFASCPPCLAQMPGYRQLYEKYKDKGFEIAGISIDQGDAESRWRGVIQNQNLSWPQYRDNDHINVNKMEIFMFPTNFLLDKNGIIIKKNVSQQELGKLLGE